MCSYCVGPPQPPHHQPLPFIPSPAAFPCCSSDPAARPTPTRVGDEASEEPAGAAPDGQRRHGGHHAALPLRPHLHQGAILLQPIPQAAGVGGGGDRRGLRQHAVQAGGPDRRGGLRPGPPHLLQHQQALRALRRRGRHPRGRQPLRHLHQPSLQGVEDQAVRASPRPRRHGRGPRVHAPPLRRRHQRLRRPAALHPEPLRPRIPLLQRRVRRQPLPRLHRRAGPALHLHPPLRRRGPVHDQRHQGLVGGQVHAAVPPAVQVRRHRRGQRPGGALLPADRHRRHVPPRHGHRPLALAGRRDRRRLQAPAPPHVPPRARGGVAHGRAAQGQAPPAHHLAQELAPLPQRARHGARRRHGEVRRAHRRAGQPHGHAQLREAGQLGGRDDGRARGRAHQHGVPAQPRRAHPGGALRRARVAQPRHLQGPRQGLRRQLHGVQRVAGGELAQGPLPKGPFLPQASLRRAQEGMGRHQDGLSRQAERAVKPHKVHQNAGRGTKSLASLIIHPYSSGPILVSLLVFSLSFSCVCVCVWQDSFLSLFFLFGGT